MPTDMAILPGVAPALQGTSRRSSGHRRRCFLLALVAPLVQVQAAEFFVSANGSDASPGTATMPFATLERARDAVRASRKIAGSPTEGATVWLAPGIYWRPQTFALTAQDSGTAQAPVVYQKHGDGEVRIQAGKPFDAADFKAVTDGATLARLDTSARGKVLQLDLKALGVSHPGPFPNVFTDGGGILELYFKGERMPLSRWPNAGYVTMAKVVDKGGERGAARHGGTFVYREDRPGRWSVDRGVWLAGFWRVPWQPYTARVKTLDPAKREITFAEPFGGGLGSKYAGPAGDGKEPWCAVNLLEEIDLPGEWCVDFPSQTLFFWPPGELSSGPVFLADLDAPLISLTGVTNFVLRNFILEGGLGNGIEISGGTGNLVAGCTFRNLGRTGVIVSGGTSNGVRSSDFYALGHGGIYLSGGNRKTLSPCGNFAENNHLHHLGVRKQTYAPAVLVGSYETGEAVGVRVAHNLMHDLPHAAVLYGGNEHRFEFNEAYRVALNSGDVGAFYTWHDWTSRGNILRHNFVHDSPRANAFYLDDGDSGDMILGNVVYRLSYGPFIGGGHDNLVQNNLIVECERGIHLDARGVARGYATNKALINRLQSFNVERPPWRTRYPALTDLLKNHPGLPTGDVIENNVVVACKKPLDLSGKPDELRFVTVRENLQLPLADAGIEDVAKLDFALRPGSPAFTKLSAFKPIPFGQIGLFTDEFRKQLPARQTMSDESPQRVFDSATDVRASDRKTK